MWSAETRVLQVYDTYISREYYHNLSCAQPTPQLNSMYTKTAVVQVSK